MPRQIRQYTVVWKYTGHLEVRMSEVALDESIELGHRAIQSQVQLGGDLAAQVGASDANPIRRTEHAMHVEEHMQIGL